MLCLRPPPPPLFRDGLSESDKDGSFDSSFKYFFSPPKMESVELAPLRGAERRNENEPSSYWKDKEIQRAIFFIFCKGTPLIETAA